MTSQSAWAPGALTGVGLAWQPAFAAADLNGLPYLASVMSSVVFDNTLALDQFLDLSFVGAFASAQAVLAGAGISFLMGVLQNDGVTYGDGRLTAGAQLAAYQPLTDPLGGITMQAGTITAIAGDFGYAPLRPAKFRLIATNYTAFPLATSGNMASIATYRQNLNA